MSSSPFHSDKPVQVTVETGRDLAEVFLINHSFMLVARGVGRLEVTVAPGVYNVKAQLGDSIVERLEVVNEEMTIDLSAELAVPGAAPLEEAERADVSHGHLAAALSQRVQAMGDGGYDDTEVFLLARRWTGDDAPADSTREAAPGISLHALNGTKIADSGQEGELFSTPESGPAAGVTVEVDPGAYLLRWSDPAGVPVEQAVAVAEGWQTQVFLLENTAAAAEVSVLMSRHLFDPLDPALAAVEEARAALAGERKVATEAIGESLFGAFDNPMLDLFGAHLMLIGAEVLEEQAGEETRAASPAAPVTFDQELFDHVVARLGSILGERQPDVAALATKTSKPPSPRPLGSLPMLWRSWRLVVEASNENPKLIDTGLWRQSMGTLPLRPFFTWSMPDNHAELADQWESAVARAALGTASSGDRLRLSESMLAPRSVIDAAVDRAHAH